MRILVVESGSSKTVWTEINQAVVLESIRSNGLNASYMSQETLIEQIGNALSDDFLKLHFDTIFYYGAGCSGLERTAKMEKSLAECFPNSSNIIVKNDLFAAAHSLLGHEPGLVGILGTGSNIGYYDGQEITQTHSSFGYLLGDEGGGVTLGKRLLTAYLKKYLSIELQKKFFEKYRLNDDELIVQLYSSKQANKWLAGFAPFLAENKQHPEIIVLIKDVYQNYFDELVKPYMQKGYKQLNLTGSVAWAFQKEIEEVATVNGVEIGKVTKEPLQDLIEFHKVH